MSLSLTKSRKQGWINRLAAMGSFGTCSPARRTSITPYDDTHDSGGRTLQVLLVAAWAVALVAIVVRFA